jgi:hypothetical protein
MYLLYLIAGIAKPYGKLQQDATVKSTQTRKENKKKKKTRKKLLP